MAEESLGDILRTLFHSAQCDIPLVFDGAIEQEMLKLPHKGDIEE